METTFASAAVQPRRLDPRLLTEEQREFRAFLDAHVSGQEDAKDEFVALLGEIRNPFRNKKIPLSRMLVGPSTSGKTLMFKLLVAWVNGDESYMLFFQGSEYMERHQLNRMIGAPPGYLGHKPKHEEKRPLQPGEKDTSAELSQHNLVESYRLSKKKDKVLFVLFDEFEKFHWDFSMFMLGVLREGRATLGDLTESIFENCVLGFTSNLGAHELDKLSHPVGFSVVEKKVVTIGDVRSVVLRELKKGYAPEFRNRIGKVVFFKGLGDEELLKVVGMEIGKLQDRVIANSGGKAFIITADDNAKRFLLKDPKGRDEDREKGPIPVMQERLTALLETPLGNNFLLGLLKQGDMVAVTHKEGDDTLTFDVTADPLAALTPPTTDDVTTGNGATRTEPRSDNGAQDGTQRHEPRGEAENAAAGVMLMVNSLILQDFCVHLHAENGQQFLLGRQAIAAALASNGQLIELKREIVDHEHGTYHVYVMAPIELMMVLQRSGIPGVQVEILQGMLE